MVKINGIIGQVLLNYGKEYQKNNPDKVKRWNKEWAKNNSEKIKEKQKKIRSTKKFKRWRNNYEKEKRLKDPAYKLRIHLSTKIREARCGGGTERSEKSAERRFSPRKKKSLSFLFVSRET